MSRNVNVNSQSAPATLRTMRTLAVLAVLAVGCGPGSAADVADDQPAAALAGGAEAARCTVDNRQPGWECCDDDSLLCTGEGPRVCHEHRLAPLTAAECERIAADPRRPELRTYGTFCDVNASGFLWCPSARHQD